MSKTKKQMKEMKKEEVPAPVLKEKTNEDKQNEIQENQMPTNPVEKQTKLTKRELNKVKTKMKRELRNMVSEIMGKSKQLKKDKTDVDIFKNLLENIDLMEATLKDNKLKIDVSKILNKQQLKSVKGLIGEVFEPFAYSSLVVDVNDGIVNKI